MHLLFGPHNKERGERGALRITLTGIVQGVGFRPFVYRLAKEEGVSGYVSNTAGSLFVHAEGPRANLENFLRRITGEAPGGAVIAEKKVEAVPPEGYRHFSIRPSTSTDEPLFTIPPDMATCRKCEEELFDPADRRYRYPFINCTDCGPRFTIVRSVPYDRERTSMSVFTMCPLCQREYDDPETRRYHAEPNACPACGPTLVLLDGEGIPVETEDPVSLTARLILEGKIVALKGLGGFHLAADATNDDAVRKLRERKRRDEKPFAVMVPSLEDARKLCHVPREGEEILTSRESPIVILPAREDTPLSPLVAPGLSSVGVFLPYTPLHKLLLWEAKRPLVMTSGNLTDEPIAIGNGEALERLRGIADSFLVHDREILQRSDDSVVTVVGKGKYLFRRARGFTPTPIVLNGEIPPVLGLGGELKATFALNRGRFVYLSQHIGDLDDPGARSFYRDTLSFFLRFLRSSPRALCRDLHPGYYTTRVSGEIAGELGGIPVLALQHHRAHIFSLMAEYGFLGRGVGVAFDGTGYGDDGTIWGGEFFSVEGLELVRRASFRPFLLQGGDSAVKEPWKPALSLLRETFGSKEAARIAEEILRHVPLEAVDLVLQALEGEVNCVPTSSAGRLFDAVSALAGIKPRKVNYEGQAAMLLEALLRRELPEGPPYPFQVREERGLLLVDQRPMVEEVVNDIRKGAHPFTISKRFHATMGEVVCSLSERILKETGGETLLLSGGVFQNVHLTEYVLDKMTQKGYSVLVHRKVPPNDGGISLGQVFFAGNTMRGGTF